MEITMQECTLCHHSTAPEDPFCSFCGHARIVESLQVPVVRPPWFEKVLMAGTAIVGVWLIITVGVAFLREAKAVRRTRAALEANDAPQAYGWISPFVKSHPKHAEALYLAGISAVKTNRPKEAAAHYSTLVSMGEDKAAMERSSRLETIYHEQILVKASRLQCGQSPYQTFYEAYDVLGEKFRDTLVRSGASVARKCVGSDRASRANEPGYWLIHEKKFDPEFVVSTLYIGPLKSAFEQGQYQLARDLAEQGMRLWPKAKAQIDDMLGEIRNQFAKNLEGIQDLCSSLGNDPELRRGGSVCFPASPPAAVINHRDSWGNPVIYEPFSLDEETQCYRGFELISLGVDARETPADTATPAMEIRCRYEWGRPRLSPRPDRFWLPPQ